MTVTLDFSRFAVDMPYVLEVHGRELLQRFSFRPPKPGAFQAAFEVALEHPEAWTDLRLCTAFGAIEGEIALGGVACRVVAPILS